MSDTKVELNPEPQIPSCAQAGIEYVSDTKGRRIGIRKLSPLDRMRLMRVVGADGAGNPQYFGMCLVASSVAEIDGIPESIPQTVRQIEAMIGQLDDHGLQAMTPAIARMSGMLLDEEELALAKN